MRRLAAATPVGLIETSGGQEDVQSFAWEAAGKLAAALRHARAVTACELLAGYQAAALSGPSSALGLKMRQGILAAFAEVNAKGGVHGQLAGVAHDAELTQAERGEREEFLVEGCYLMNNRFRAQEVWERLDFDPHGDLDEGPRYPINRLDPYHPAFDPDVLIHPINGVILEGSGALTREIKKLRQIGRDNSSDR